MGHSLDFGNNETYLVHLLNPGDYVLGFDLYGENTNDRILHTIIDFCMYDVLGYDEMPLKKSIIINFEGKNR